MNDITVKNITKGDCEIISKSFIEQGWNKSKELYEYYLEEYHKGNRDVILAEYNNEFAGYVTIDWDSTYPMFKENNIPEIKDFNVLIKYRRKNIGTVLMDEAEKRIEERSMSCGLRVGLLPDYGAAQILYIKRGYVPDGLGVYYDDKQLNYNEKTVVDDDLTIGLIKKLEE